MSDTIWSVQISFLQREEICDQFTFDESGWKSWDLLDVVVEESAKGLVVSDGPLGSEDGLLDGAFWNDPFILLEVARLHFECVHEFGLAIVGGERTHWIIPLARSTAS